MMMMMVMMMMIIQYVSAIQNDKYQNQQLTNL